MVKQSGNIYLIAAIAVIGGGLFGFDISSMSAMCVAPAMALHTTSSLTMPQNRHEAVSLLLQPGSRAV
jgi:hypothetical protein